MTAIFSAQRSGGAIFGEVYGVGGPVSVLSGTVALDSVVASGSMGSASGTITTDDFRNAANTLLASTNIPKVTVLRVSDMSVLVNLTDQVTNGAGVLTITNAALIAGTLCLVVTCNADGAAFGCQPYTVA